MKQIAITLSLLLCSLPAVAMDTRKRDLDAASLPKAKRTKLNDDDTNTVPSQKALDIQNLAHIENYALPVDDGQSKSLSQIDAFILDPYYESLQKNILRFFDFPITKQFTDILVKKYKYEKVGNHYRIRVNDRVSTITVSSDDIVYIGSNRGHIYKRIATQGWSQPFIETDSKIISLALSQDERTLYSAHANGTILSWDLKAGQCMVERFTGRKDMSSLIVKSDGHLYKENQPKFRLHNGSILSVHGGWVIEKKYPSLAYALCRYALYNSRYNLAAMQYLAKTKTFQQTAGRDNDNLSKKMQAITIELEKIEKIKQDIDKLAHK